MVFKMTTRRIVLFLICFVVSGLAGLRGQEVRQEPLQAAHAIQTIPKKPETPVPFEEKLLGTLPPEYENPPDITGSTVFLDNPAQWGFVARQNGKLFVVINNKKGPEFDQIRLLFQSPDRRTIGYVAEESHAAGRKTFLVLGSKTIPLQQGESIDLGETNHLLGAGLSLLSPPIFSLDSKKVAYISFHEDKKKEAVAILEGDWGDPAPVTIKYGAEFDWVWEPVFSPDGSTVAYAAGEAKKRSRLCTACPVQGMFIVIGDKKGPEFERVRFPVFNAAGTVVAYQASLLGHGDPNTREIAVVGDKKRGAQNVMGQIVGFAWVGIPVFSPDGATISYPVLQSADFLPDKRPKHGFVVVGNKKGPKFDSVGEPVFSPDGTGIAYSASVGEKQFIVLVDKKGPEFDDVQSPVFSPDGRIIAYQAKQSQKQFMILGDKRGPEFDEVGEPVFSPDRATAAYRARRDKKWLIVVGEKLGPEFDDVFRPYFSPDGNKVAYGARQGREFWWKVMDVR
jgi:WD40-like Beta Propeller Repeat